MTKAKLAVMVVFAFTVTSLFPTMAGAAIDAEAIVTGKCTACHSADRIRSAAKTKSEWARLVEKEIGRGAQLTKSEQEAVVDWLTAEYGQTEVAKSVQTPAEPQKTQVAQGENTSPTSDGSLPFNQQAYTGVELWQFLLGGGALVGGGAFLRRRKS